MMKKLFFPVIFSIACLLILFTAGGLTINSHTCEMSGKSEITFAFAGSSGCCCMNNETEPGGMATTLDPVCCRNNTKLYHLENFHLPLIYVCSDIELECNYIMIIENLINPECFEKEIISGYRPPPLIKCSRDLLLMIHSLKIPSLH